MNIYQRRIEKCKEEISIHQKTSDRLSIVRLVVFIFSVVVIVTLASQGSVSMIVTLTPVCIMAFIYLIKEHNRVDDLKQYTSFLKDVNEQEVLRLENKLADFPTGEEFAIRDQPYTSDLDIFGKHSVFQLLNRATTETGRATLAHWLSTPAATADISARQEAITELSAKFEWRQHFQASGMKFSNTREEYEQLRSWADKPARLLPKRVGIMAIAIVLSVLSTIAAIYFLSHILVVESVDQLIPYLIPLVIMLIINSFVLRRVRSVAETLTENIHPHLNTLQGYRTLLASIESETFKSQLLRQCLASINTSDSSAVKEIKRLEKILEVFKLKGGKRMFNNMFYGLINSLWFLDVHLIIRTEQWKERNRTSLSRWSSVIGQFEALTSIAGFYYANPSNTFAVINQSEPYYIDFKTLGHPLISNAKRVCNDFTLTGRGTIAMITGSNMAGKSTFLRTLGVNIVLALMGAPCCATQVQVSHLDVFSSMRTQDNLEEGVSSFYAELKRIEQLLRKIEAGQPVFFLLDEIFKGTNSKDRHRGGFSLIMQLVELSAFGVISTHDLELATLTGQDHIASNFSFNSKLSNADLQFDYRLTPGLCTDFNASELMRRSGIKIL
jgi:DNA mismatch repair ATPase MutS